MSGLVNIAVGLEINQAEVLAVQVRHSRRGPVVSGFAREPLQPGAVTTAHVARPDELVRAVTSVLQRARAGRVNICMVVGCESMDARELRYPTMPERELLANIQWELQQLFRVSADGEDDAERLVDYELLPHRNQHEQDDAEPDNTQAYLAVSVPKRIVYEYLKPLQQARIYPEIFDVGAFSLPWSLPRGGGVGYLHLGPQLTNFVLLDNGAYELSRQGTISLEPVLQTIEHPSAGLKLLQQALAAVDDAQAEPVSKSLGELVRWIEETLEYVRVQRGSFTVTERMQTLVLSGVGATVPGIVALIAERTGLYVVPAVPPLLEFGSYMPAEEVPAFALAAALAQRGLSEL